jgi:hypothetical protein
MRECPIPKEFPMRNPALAFLTVATFLAAAPAQAQTYNPKYPVCLQTYHIGGGIIKCDYDTLAQCNTTALGLGGQCIENPFFAGPRDTAGPNYPRPRGAY